MNLAYERSHDSPQSERIPGRIGSVAFSDTAGELRYAGGNILGDLNGDGNADFSITVTGNPTITASDFLL